MKITLAQLPISKIVEENLKTILQVLEQSETGTWVAFPEGMLSGYYPEEPDYLASIDPVEIDLYISKIHEQVVAKDLICLFGSAVKRESKWFNATIILGKDQRWEYFKNNLSNLDRKCFTAGNDLPVYVLGDITFGVQMCRENAFPEQWKALKKQGAEIIFHINNAVREDDGVRKHLLISRAFENQYFIVSVNTFTNTSPLASFVISPKGIVVLESQLKQKEVCEIEIDLSEVSKVYLDQERTDLVDIVLK